MTEDPIQSFSARRAGRQVRERTAEVPWHVGDQLRDWLRRYLTPQLERRVANRMGLSLGRRSALGEALEANGAFAASGNLISQLSGNERLLDAIDYALQLDEPLTQELHWRRRMPDPDHPDNHWSRLERVAELSETLDDGGSTLIVVARDDRARLASGADPTVQAAVDHAASSANEAASVHLRRAWASAYDRETDPDGAYRDAVRAVEVAISTVVSPDNDRQTLGTAVRDLRAGAHKYELVLLDKPGDGTVDPLLGLLERLWEGQKSRHGAGYGARPSTLEEARAAVQIAVLAVQWLSDGALRPRGSTPGTP